MEQHANHVTDSNAMQAPVSAAAASNDSDTSVTASRTEHALSLLVPALIASKAKDVIVVNTSKKTPLCDYMVFVTGLNKRHIQVLGTRAKKLFMQEGMKHARIEASDQWVLCDSGTDIMVHCFTEEGRIEHQLDRKWVLTQADEFQGRVYGDDMVGRKIVAYKSNRRSRKRLQKLNKKRNNYYVPI